MPTHFTSKIKRLVSKKERALHKEQKAAKKAEAAHSLPPASSGSDTTQNSHTLSEGQRDVLSLQSNEPSRPGTDNAENQWVLPEGNAFFQLGSLLGDYPDSREENDARSVGDKDSNGGVKRDSGFKDSSTGTASKRNSIEENNNPFINDSELSGTPASSLEFLPSEKPEQTNLKVTGKAHTDGEMQLRDDGENWSRDLHSKDSVPDLTRSSFSSRSSSRLSSYSISSNYEFGAPPDSPRDSLRSFCQIFTAQEYQKNIPNPVNCLVDDLDRNVPHTSIDVSQTTAPPVVHEWIHPQQIENRNEVISREIHTHEVYPQVLPIVQKEYLPPKHLLQKEDGTLVPVDSCEDGGWLVGT